jgi:hypothetical protein
MRIPAEVGPRPLSDELAFVCRTLRADEADILAKALRRGVFEIYKAVVLHELQRGRLDPEEARRMLGSLVVARAGAGRASRTRGRVRAPGRARRRTGRGRRR